MHFKALAASFPAEIWNRGDRSAIPMLLPDAAPRGLHVPGIARRGAAGRRWLRRLSRATPPALKTQQEAASE